MDAQLKKITITPTSFDKEGEVSKEVFATIVLEVPIESKAQADEVSDLRNVYKREWVTLTIEEKQMAIPKLKAV